jgi:hypothetical protein
MYEGYEVVSGKANEQIFCIKLSPLFSLFFPLRPTSPVAIYQQIINTYSAFYFYFFLIPGDAGFQPVPFLPYHHSLQGAA